MPLKCKIRKFTLTAFHREESMHKGLKRCQAKVKGVNNPAWIANRVMIMTCVSVDLLLALTVTCVFGKVKVNHELVLFQIALRLHHTTLGGRRINVEFSTSESKKADKKSSEESWLDCWVILAMQKVTPVYVYSCWKFEQLEFFYCIFLWLIYYCKSFPL